MGNASVLLSVSMILANPPAPAVQPAPAVKAAANRITGVTVYQAAALVTREVSAPEGIGSFELVVSPLPAQTQGTSLYSEGTDGIRVLATRYRTRAVQEDTRAEVRKLEAQAKELQASGQKIQSEIKAVEENVQTLGKIETFTTATMQHLTDRGLLSAETTVKLADYIMGTRGGKTEKLVGLQQLQQGNQEQVAFVQRQLQELTANSSKTENDAVIVVEKEKQAAGKVRLHYLVDSASWRPQYKFRAAKQKDPVLLEYLAAVTQKTGEDWSNVNLVLSTAQPLLNAAPPDLKALEVTVAPGGPTNAGMAGMAQGGSMTQGGMPGLSSTIQGGMPGLSSTMAFDSRQLGEQSKALRSQAAQNYNSNNAEVGGKFINDAAALEQTRDLLVKDEKPKAAAGAAAEAQGEGPSVTYHLGAKLSIPSRNDEQIVEVAHVPLKPAYFYKAVPVLTPHVYRLATLTNESEYVLLPGEATMYLGADFVGRTSLPLVAIGEQFTAGFGVDPQIQVQRQLVDKSRSTQGGNQVLKYDYRILVSSYKGEAVRLQLWDRLPHAEAQAVAVTLNEHKPELSEDPLYLREDRPKNLLRWDLELEPKRNGIKALVIRYDFKLELDRQMHIPAFTTR